MIDYKGRVESYSREMLRKESQIKEMQTRLETGDGCKYQNIVYNIIKILFSNLRVRIFYKLLHGLLEAKLLTSMSFADT